MFKWLKAAGIAMLVGLLVAAFAGTAFAQGPVQDGDGARDLIGAGVRGGRGPAYGFVDEDGDGVNDRYNEDCEFVDEDGDGVCDLCGVAQEQHGVAGAGRGYGYVDEDGDGVNDRYGAAEFVDEDGDGVCDVHGTIPGQGMRDGTGIAQGMRQSAAQGRGRMANR